MIKKLLGNANFDNEEYLNHTFNKLRASVLGANDGIVSVACLILGVAGVIDSSEVIFIAGAAGTMAGIISMSIGEYISVSSLRDMEKALLKRDNLRIKNNSKLNQKKFNIDPQDLTNPWHAAFASARSFFLGSSVPMVVIIFSPPNLRIPMVFIAVLVALAVTGILSARVGGANVLRATLRVVVGGAFAMLTTYGIGLYFHVAGV